MDRERAVVVDVSRALYAAAERLPSGSPWIGAFCEIAQLVEGGEPRDALSASERLRRRGIQARARTSSNEARWPEGRRARDAHASGAPSSHAALAPAETESALTEPGSDAYPSS